MRRLTDEELRDLIKRLEYALLTAKFAMLTNDDKTTPTLRAEIDKANTKCAALFRAWPKEP